MGQAGPRQQRSRRVRMVDGRQHPAAAQDFREVDLLTEAGRVDYARERSLSRECRGRQGIGRRRPAHAPRPAAIARGDHALAADAKEL